MNDFQPSDELIAHVEAAEGFVSCARPDPVGILTYGFGHRCYPGGNPPAEVSLDQARAILAGDLQVAGNFVRACVKVELTQAQYDALTDFTFNLGGNALASSTMLRNVNSQDWDGAAQQMLRWDHAHVSGKLVVLEGLRLRRVWDSSRLIPPDMSEPGPAPADEPPVTLAVTNPDIPLDFQSIITMDTGTPPNPEAA